VGTGVSCRPQSANAIPLLFVSADQVSGTSLQTLEPLGSCSIRPNRPRKQGELWIRKKIHQPTICLIPHRSTSYLSPSSNSISTHPASQPPVILTSHLSTTRLLLLTLIRGKAPTTQSTLHRSTYRRYGRAKMVSSGTTDR